MVQEPVSGRRLSAGNGGGGQQPGRGQAPEGEAGGDEQADRGAVGVAAGGDHQDGGHHGDADR
jgi:hypothetical protein